MPYKKTGGVYSFCNSIISALGEKNELTVHKRGSKDNRKNKYVIALEQLLNYFSFIIKLLFNDFDIIFINTSLSKRLSIRDGIFIVISKLFRKSVLLYIHGFQEEYVNSKWVSLGYFNADTIVVLAEEFKSLIEQAGYIKPIFVSRNPIDAALLRSLSKSNLEIKLKTSPLNILFISRIEEDKGIMILLEAFSILSKKIPEVNLFIAGTGRKLNDAKEFVDDNDIKNVVFYGFVSGKEKAELFKKSDILVFPTYHKEGLPICVLEAMAAGLPIITRPVGGIKDFFENEKMGYAIDSVDANEFVKKVEKLINSDNYSNICEYNYIYARQNFSPKVIAKNLLDILEEVVNE